MESAIIPEAFETRCLWVRKLMRRGRGVEGREGAQERAENAAKEEYRGGGRMMSLSSRASPPYERVGQNNSPLPLLPAPSSLSALARRFFLPPCPPPLNPPSAQGFCLSLPRPVPTSRRVARRTHFVALFASRHSSDQEE